MESEEKQSLTVGLVGGLGALSGSDILFKLIHANTSLPPRNRFEIVFEQHDFEDMDAVVDAQYDPRSRKFYIFNVIKEMEKRGVDLILLGCFISHTFLDEIQAEVKPRILNLFDAIRHHLLQYWPAVKRVGVLTSGYSRKHRLFEKNLPQLELVYPHDQVQNQALTEAIYGKEGIKAGYLKGRSIEMINEVCRDLVAQDVELIIPGYTEVSMVLDAISGDIAVPIIDVNKVYAKSAVGWYQQDGGSDEFILGVVGGVGPAATVDFMGKAIGLTQAQKDQDHIRMLVEHNPKIPDRTENLIANGPDPSIAIYSACMKLEQGGARAIAIPCNTAHAFIEKVQPFLEIPIINMLEETAKTILKRFPQIKKVGLLATTGTIRSEIYQKVLSNYGLDTLVPDPAYQDLVMSSIYGEQGVKAGFTRGTCHDDLLRALGHLLEKGADAAILGCTELPLILEASDEFPIDSTVIPLLDPTWILAQKCVALAVR